MDDNYKRQFEVKKVKFRYNVVGSKKENTIWTIFITILSFVLSAFILFISDEILKQSHIITSLLVVFVIVFIGIIFDIIGIAVTASNETPFHALASKKYFGAKQSIKLIRNANKVSSFCNDVVGDICGVISGTASALIVIRISQITGITQTALMGLVIGGLVASLTVGGKSVGKTIAIAKSNHIVYQVGVMLQFISDRTRITKISGNNKNNVKRDKKRKRDEN